MQSAMATSISSYTSNLPAVNLRQPALLFYPQPPTPSRRRLFISTTPSAHQTPRRSRHVVVATSTETTTTTIADEDQKKATNTPMDRGSLAEKSGRSDGQLTARWREIHGSKNWEGLLDPIDTVLRGELIRYGEFAQACYDSFDYDVFSPYCGTCRYPPKSFFRDVGLDGVGYEVTRYLYATSSVKAPRFSIYRKVLSKLWSENGTFVGFVAVSTDEETARIGRRDIAVAWRGTVTRLEWVSDITATQTPVSELGIPCPDPNVKVETGFGELYTGKDLNCQWCKYSAREQVLAEVRRLVDKYQARGEEVSVTVTGHSLGSALAMLCAYDVAETGANVSRDGTKRAPVCVFSFSGPRVGNPKFKDRFERYLGVRALRIKNVHDIVPSAPGCVFLVPINIVDDSMFPQPVLQLLDWLPLGCVYTHLGVELALDHTASPFLKATMDLACYHNQEAHLHLLDGYQGRGKPFKPCGRDPALVNKAADFLLDEHMVPPVWRQDANKGMIRTEDGRWVLPPRHRIVDDHPEDMVHHLQQLGLITN